MEAENTNRIADDGDLGTDHIDLEIMSTIHSGRKTYRTYQSAVGEPFAQDYVVCVLLRHTRVARNSDDIGSHASHELLVLGSLEHYFPRIHLHLIRLPLQAVASREA